VKVVRIGPPHGRLGHQRVVVEGGAAFRLSPADINALGVEVGAELDAARLQQLRTRAERALALDVAHRLLAVRLRSRQELTVRLRRRGISADVLAAVLADLERHGFVDDRRFADAWVRSRIALLPSSRIRLRYELAHKGVAREVIDRTLSETLNEQEEGALARRVAGSRLRRYRGLPPEVVYRRLASVLQRRGFSADVIARTLRDLLDTRTTVTD